VIIVIPTPRLDGSPAAADFGPDGRIENSVIGGQEIDIDRRTRIAARRHRMGADERVARAEGLEDPADFIDPHRQRRMKVAGRPGAPA